jgi:prophage maintenance system killer protein
MIFPEKFDVLTVHARLIAETGGKNGLRDEALLESALAAVYNRHHYELADVVGCAATYAYHLTMSNQELVALFVGIASSELSREQIEGKLRDKVKPKSDAA